jgi:hypothetical protein
MQIPKPIGLLIASIITAGMTVAITWASLSASIIALPSTLTNEPWFIATCIDAYLALFIIYGWVCCIEKSLSAKAFWFLMILGLGNIGVGAYFIKRVLAMPSIFTLSQFFGINLAISSDTNEERHLA